MSNFPDYMNATEVRIVNRLLTAILTSSTVPLTVRVNDGEEWATDWTTDRKVIQRETAATDVTIYALAEKMPDGTRQRIGTITLIHGNEDDVISDASYRTTYEGSEDLIDALCDHANFA
jgi:hypothetical protein